MSTNGKLDAYLNTPIVSDQTQLDRVLVSLPMPPESHITAWQAYVDDAKKAGLWPVLRHNLVQLQFAIESGMSQTEAYRAATRRGRVDSADSPTLRLANPEALTLTIYPSVAGPVPVLHVPERTDFVAIVQALTHRNEPMSIPDSMGACMVVGYNNWGRINAYRQRWAVNLESAPTEAAWQDEFRRLIPQKQLYQDRFLILSDGPYSSVSAESLDLNSATWRDLSFQIRLAHECAHYFTKRAFVAMRNHLHDELLADYAGLVAGIGRFRADWFLRFMGLEAYPAYRRGARLENYVPDEWLDSAEFPPTAAALHTAAHTLEQFDQTIAYRDRTLSGQGVVLSAIASLSLAELAAPNGLAALTQRAAVLTSTNRLSASPINSNTPILHGSKHDHQPAAIFAP